MTETVYEPRLVDAPTATVSVVVPEFVGVTETMEVPRVAVIPVGLVGEEKVTVPENPFTLVTVREDICEDPWFTARVEGLSVTLKSGGG